MQEIWGFDDDIDLHYILLLCNDWVSLIENHDNNEFLPLLL